MAVRAFKDRRLGMFAGLRESVQTITASGAASAAGIATTIKPFGVTFISTTGTGGPHRIMLQRPKGGGIHKTIVVKMNSSADVVVVNQTTADKWWGSTINSALFSSTTLKGQGQALRLVSVSTSQWALISQRGTTAATQYVFALQNSSN